MSSIEQDASTENSCKNLRSPKNLGFKCSLCGEHKRNSAHIFHRYPKDPEMSNRWAAKSERKWVISASVSMRYNRFRVCSKHFLNEDYSSPQKIRLLPGAVPKQYPDFTSKLSLDPLPPNYVPSVFSLKKGSSEHSLSHYQKRKVGINPPANLKDNNDLADSEQEPKSKEISTMTDLTKDDIEKLEQTVNGYKSQVNSSHT